MLTAEWFGRYPNATSGLKASPSASSRPATEESDIDQAITFDTTTHGGSATHAIDSGRFAYIPVPTVQAQGAHPERNSYGILTDMMNNNPSPFVTRVDSICGLPSQAKLPGCKELKGAIAMRDLSGGCAL